MSRGTLFVLDGASASGKTTLALALLKANPELILVPRYTTRGARAAESDNIEYIFVTPEQFRKMADENAFLEHRSYQFGMSYGLPRKEVDAILDTGESAIAIADLGRARKLKAQCPDAVTILIDVPPEILRKRLIARGTNTSAQIAERLANARTIARGDYDHVVENKNDLGDTLRALQKIIDDRLNAT